MSQTKAQLIDGKVATVEFSGGSASAPSIAFSGDTNTGIYSPGADQLAISTNGTGRLFVDASGNVGIGANSPSFLYGGSSNLEIGSVLRFRGFSEIAHGGSGNPFYINNFAASPTIFLTANTERLRITSAGLVGIGTSSPATTLDVNGTVSCGTAGGVAISVPNGVAAIRNSGSVSNTLYFDVCNGGAAHGSFEFRSSNAATTRMIIDGSGRVGIGTTSPSQRLTVGAGSETGGHFVRINGANSDIYIGQSSGTVFGASTGSINFIGSDAAVPFGVGTTGNQALVLGTNNSERCRIDTSGRLLVGTSSSIRSESLLQVVGANYPAFQMATWGSATNPELLLTRSRGTQGSPSVPLANDAIGIIMFNGWNGSGYDICASITAAADGEWNTSGDTTDNPGRLVFSTTADGASSPTERARITNAGILLVGRTGPDGPALVQAPAASGTPGFCSAAGVTTSITHFEFRNPNGIVGTISTNGSGTAYNTSSDHRLKENVIPVADGIPRLLQLKPSRFNFIADPDRTVDGFIAHEVQAVVPEAITGEKDAVDDDGNPIYQGIDQSKLVPLLTAALQEAVAKIESLEARLTAAGI